MSWGKRHDTAQCSRTHRKIIEEALQKYFDWLLEIRDDALRYASPRGVACAASYIELPPPHQLPEEKDQLSESFDERKSSWESPWLKDLRLVRQWQDEQTYTLYNTWFANTDHDHDTQDACQHGTDLATALDMALEAALHRTTGVDSSTFPATLRALLEHLSKGCRVLHGGGTKSGDNTGGAFFATTRHLIHEWHIEQLQREIIRHGNCLSRTREVAKGRKKAQARNQERWSNKYPESGRVTLMKSHGLGSPLREVCDSDYQESPVDS
ncbi:phosphatase family protein, partial [Metarhizium majus ARSEF 297]